MIGPAGMTRDRDQKIMDLLTEINRGGVRSRDVLMAIAAVPRDSFVRPEAIDRAWENRALPIDDGQTISQPLIVGLMTQALNLTGDERILEIGTGSGYQAAVLTELAREVISVERFPELADSARKRLGEMGYRSIQVVVGDGTLGWPELAPYDGIIVTAAAPHLPNALEQQLSQRAGARIVIPIGSPNDQELMVYERTRTGLREYSLGPVRFVPLIGKEGWQE
jgi:protein-L-isoaspartate(D-aspartate) O-methyltransferase